VQVLAALLFLLVRQREHEFGKRVVSGGDDSTLKVWYASCYQEVRTLKDLRASSDDVSVAMCIALSDGKWIVSGDIDGTVRFWDANGRQLHPMLLTATSR
jgi:WD40 repeat protein